MRSIRNRHTDTRSFLTLCVVDNYNSNYRVRIEIWSSYKEFMKDDLVR